MSKCAIKLLSDDELLNTFKQQAYDNACKYDIHNIVPQYEELYSRFCTMECSKAEDEEGY
jgi:hypothetical protein